MLVVGASLVVVTWALTSLIVVALGFLPALLTSRGQVELRATRRAAWWGVAILGVFALALSLGLPVRSSFAAAAVVFAALGLGLAGLRVARKRGWREGSWGSTRGLSRWAMFGAFTLATVFLAVAAVGAVTNYDSGLYHLGAIHYAADHGSVVGLANLYGPLAYATVEFPLAALFENGPLGAEGFRALNGFFVVLACADLLWRAGERRWSAGTFVLAAGLVFVLLPMLPTVDYWVTSPTQDSSVFVLTVVTSGYLADAITRRRWVPDASVVAALCILLVMLRPTMVAFGLAVFALLAVRWLHTRNRAGGEATKPAVACISLMAILAALVVVARDYLLSGWLQYPLSVYAFDVPWRAADPVGIRDATLGFARDPDNWQNSVSGFGWVAVWLKSAPTKWEFWLLGVGLVAAFVALLIARRISTVRIRPLAATLAPSILATAVWWLASPPSFRFAWGPLFTLASIPLGWAAWRVATARKLRLRIAKLAGWCVAMAASVATVTAIATAPGWSTPLTPVETGPFSFAVVSPVVPATMRVKLGADLQGVQPTATDQCWAVYPLCTPTPTGALRKRGADWSDGLLP